MNKEHFNKLISNYSNLDDQFKELEKLMHEFPYSQPVRMLNVKSSAILSKEEFQQRLSLAAFYTTDRTILRSLIESGKVPGDKVVFTPRTKAKAAKKPLVKKSTPAVKEKVGKIVDAESLRNEVMANLALLQEQKKSFLKLSELKTEKKDNVRRKQKKSTSNLKVKEKIVENSLQPKIKAKKEKSSPARTKKKDLIDKFIADEPRITPKKVMSENQSDLSKDSSELKEDLVSENLAVIFARQGKKSKAIDIYKKLIWKFPQKKASFAAQIEELKKKKE